MQQSVNSAQGRINFHSSLSNITDIFATVGMDFVASTELLLCAHIIHSPLLWIGRA